MSKRPAAGNDRARQLLAQEAARIIVEQGVQDFRAAKMKAVDRLGMTNHGALPGNGEIESAVAEHLQIFQGDSHSSLLRAQRAAALTAMQLLADFSPRLVGPVLAGTAGEHSAVNLHVFSDSPEQIALLLHSSNIDYRPFDRRYRSRKGQTETYPAFAFEHEGFEIEATVFPYDGLRQAPLSPVDRKPMRRADTRKVRAMLENKKGSDPINAR